MKRGKYWWSCVLMFSAFGLLSGCVTPPDPEDAKREQCGDIFCAIGEHCCDGTCYAVDDERHCGTCDVTCVGQERCVLMQTDNETQEQTYQCVGCGNAPCSETCCIVNETPVCTATDTNTSHCGACNNPCIEGQICERGQCVCIGDTAFCEGKCIALTTPDACGGCGIKCPDDTDSSLNLQESYCSLSAGSGTYACYIQCLDGFEDANDDISDGCEKSKASPSKCGNGIVEAGELCDGDHFNGVTCESLPNGYTGGTLKCSASCDRIDDSQCIASSPTTCGNRELDVDELCDGTLFRNSSNCSDYGSEYASGNLSCNANCTLNFADCEKAQCSDGEKKCIGNTLVTCEDRMWSMNGTVCTGKTPTCDDDRKSCVGCLENKNCSSGYCDLSTQTCVNCFMDSHCSEGQTCDPVTMTCKSPTVASWTVVVEAPSRFDESSVKLVDNDTSNGKLSSSILNSGAYNVGPWPMETASDFSDEYVEISYDKSLFAGKREIKVSFNYNINDAQKGPAQIAVAWYDGTAEIGLKSQPATTTTTSMEYIQSVGDLKTPRLRIQGYANAKPEAGTIRIFPIQIEVR